MLLPLLLSITTRQTYTTIYLLYSITCESIIKSFALFARKHIKSNNFYSFLIYLSGLAVDY